MEGNAARPEIDAPDAVLMAMHLLSAGIGPHHNDIAKLHWPWVADQLGKAWAIGYANRLVWVNNGLGIDCQFTTRGNRAVKAFRRRMGMPDGMIDLPGRIVDETGEGPILTDFVGDHDNEKGDPGR